MVLTDKFIDNLARPMYVLRMARPLENHPTLGLGAKRRASKARQEIRELAIDYVSKLDQRREALDELTKLGQEYEGGYR